MKWYALSGQNITPKKLCLKKHISLENNFVLMALNNQYTARKQIKINTSVLEDFSSLTLK